MIKNIYKYLGFLLIVLGLFLFGNYSSAVLDYSGYAYYGTLGYSFTNGIYTYDISNSLNFSTEIGNSSSDLFFWTKDSYGYGYYQSYFWRNGKLYTIVGNDNDVWFQGYVDKWCILPVSENPGIGINNGHHGCEGKFNYSLSDILSINPNFVTFSIENVGNISPNYGAGIVQLCFSDLNNYYCFGCSHNGSNMECPSGFYTGNNYNIPNAKFETVSQLYFGESPFLGSTGGSIDFYTGDNYIINGDIDDYINYYEWRYGRHENMCYVGSSNLSGLYESSDITFKPGSGDTIFGLYYYLYNSFGNNRIANVGTFINSWLINYGQYFETSDEDRLFLANYSGPDTSISLYYTGFIDPFVGHPAVVWYMAYNYFNYYNVENTQGEEIAFYCDMKLNYDSYKDGSLDFGDTKDKVNPGIIGNLNDYKNNHFGSDVGYSKPVDGSIFDQLIGSGYGVPDDLSPIELFKDFYNKLNGLLRDFDNVGGTGIIPWWILYPMLFLVLFRIIRH